MDAPPGMLFMYLPGAMMKNPKLNQKLGSKITEAMIGPYRKILNEDGKDTEKN